MRFLNALKNDIRFQIKYGFYFLYAFFSAVYATALILAPSEYKSMAASLIILTDPAMLGIFFIGGIWLLEKGEGLHRFWGVSPLRPLEYILAQSISLALLSALSAALIALAGLQSTVRLAFLSFSVFMGAAIFNLLGLIVASYARSVNHYMVIVILPLAFLSLPPVLAALGKAPPLLELFPGTALWRMIASSVAGAPPAKSLPELVLLPWLALLLFFANRRIGSLFRSGGGENT